MRALLVMALVALAGDGMAADKIAFRDSVNRQRLLNAQSDVFGEPLGNVLPEAPQNYPIGSCASGALSLSPNTIILTRLRNVSADLDVAALIAFAGNSLNNATLGVGLAIYEAGLVEQGFTLSLVDGGWVTTTDIAAGGSPLAMVLLRSKPRLDKTKRYMIGVVVNDSDLTDAVRSVSPTSAGAHGTLIESLEYQTTISHGADFPTSISHRQCNFALFGASAYVWAAAVSRQAFDFGQALDPTASQDTRIFF